MRASVKNYCLEFGRSSENTFVGCLIAFSFPIENGGEFYCLDHNRPRVGCRTNWEVFTDKTLDKFFNDILDRSKLLGFQEEYLINRYEIDYNNIRLVEFDFYGRSVQEVSELISRVIADPELEINPDIYSINKYKKSI